ncbi:hypothetical protein BKA65DRAFT_556322 [Rhexocercosporidium sp. MPI-PUGE-AT-0058]|nr:hypothetical protein BKA65DRAFT_556322 [Rhexocercosporidium sp. MPI-PUGE-AT-0058]
MKLPAFLSRWFSLGFNTSEEDEVELDSRNTQPGPATRSERIIEEITAGTSICTICTDAVAFGHGALYNIWQCHECYNVYHYQCIKSWERQRLRNRSLVWRGVPSWKCPTCSAPQRTVQGPKCWCGKQDHRLCTIDSPNVCGYVCGKAGKCGHVIYGLLGVLLHFHIRWNTMPYRYSEIDTFLESVGVFAGVVFVVFPVVCFILLRLFRGTVEFLEAALNLRTIGGERRCKRLIRFFGNLALAAFFFFILSLLVIGFTLGPKIGWYHQMIDSCKGLDTGIYMDKNLHPGVPATKFIERRLPKTSTEYQIKTWYLGQHLKPTEQPSNAPFQFYTRLSGKIAGHHVAVDVDVERNSWRLFRLSGADRLNEWLAHDSKKLDYDSRMPSLPKFLLPNEALLSKGTFSQATWLEPHMEIPELDMVITNMYRFLTDPEYEPFLRVFNFRGFNMSMEAEDQGEREPADLWSGKPHDREVMRMAAFGYGRGHLTMCAREYVAYQDAKAVPSKEPGIQQAELVPFGIIAAMRQRYTETGMRGVWVAPVWYRY